MTIAIVLSADCFVYHLKVYQIQFPILMEAGVANGALVLDMRTILCVINLVG